MDQDHGDWIEWNGGECPVAPQTLVEVRFRDAAMDHPNSWRASFWSDSDPSKDCWLHDNNRADIIAYRIVEAA